MEVVVRHTDQVLLELMPNNEAERIAFPIAQGYSINIVGSDFVGLFDGKVGINHVETTKLSSIDIF